ncbi:MAG: hypothetical protein JWO89_3269 [Verrucomicrobiaceae bacterium]|nr:hypothetical protein [Verrucomicrobiaceae bacterium]
MVTNWCERAWVRSSYTGIIRSSQGKARGTTCREIHEPTGPSKAASEAITNGRDSEAWGTGGGGSVRRRSNRFAGSSTRSGQPVEPSRRFS